MTPPPHSRKGLNLNVTNRPRLGRTRMHASSSWIHSRSERIMPGCPGPSRALPRRRSRCRLQHSNCVDLRDH